MVPRGGARHLSTLAARVNTCRGGAGHEWLPGGVGERRGPTWPGSFFLLARARRSRAGARLRRRALALPATVGGALPTHVLRAMRPTRSTTERTSRRAVLRAASTPAEGASGGDGTRGHSGSGEVERTWGWSPEWGRSTGGGRSEGGARVRSNLGGPRRRPWRQREGRRASRARGRGRGGLMEWGEAGVVLEELGEGHL